MLSGLASFFLSRPALLGLGLIGLVLFVQTARLNHAKSDLAHQKAAVAAAQASLGASEAFRASEHAKDVAAVQSAESACEARVAAALQSGAAIHRLVQKPVAHDPKSGCPLRELVPAGELRDALSH